MTVALDKSVEDFITSPHQLFIDGRWVDAASGRTFTTPDPATGQTLAHVAEADAEDVDRAVRAARRAFEHGPWSRMTASERGRIIWRIGDLILEHADELAQLESLDNGKPLAVARVADVPLAADLFHYMAGWATKIEGNTISLSVPYLPGSAFHAYTLREPVGVVAQIIPWNFPLLMAAWKLGPALATGNVVILKPAEQTPLSALRLAELIAEAGVPDGVVNVLPGYGETAGAALAAHDGVDKVAFTGSTEVGRLIVHAAAGNLKKVTLELGGKSPNVVFDDADPDLAVQGAANAIFFNHGQCCIAGSRLFVHRSRFDEVVEGVAEIARGIRLGPGLDADTQMGPLVSDEQLRRVTGFLESGRQEGARTVTGGERHGDQGYFVQPTVITDVRPDMRLVREEIFGPVVVASPFSDLDEIAAQANDTVYGLGAGIWTRDISKAHALAGRIRAGTIWINCYNVFDAALPFGGYKQSGWGREMGHQALDAYTEVKSVCTQLHT
ncbi:aldehyde dehydrogenase family protein [Streptosporangium saharense]|uniref:Phenylacetaldehyde dehydrogenase n=1 Tax=Streptosporangium saharense TaxID=1706840 RepID=A0A7W7QHB1_9ACTN|nr:aldehyde dehydrogenase family protein [Streptosporangium saharense]MBB4913463.1 phenylacetaldehyde dehydrogenase [Streptosporangium saharense]